MKNLISADVLLNLIPFFAIAFLFQLQNHVISGVTATIALLVLLFAVVSAVHHAEVIAHKVGEPFGTLVLALAVTVIETSLLISMLMSSSEKVSSLPEGHHLCNCHDYLQWCCWIMFTDRRNASQGAIFQN
jgi:Ca2+:H+ antiporter